MIRIITGNLLDFVGEGIVCHQVNCKGVMGRGVALEIREEYPEVFSQYESHCRRKLINEIKGTCLLTTTDNGHTIANLFGQVSYGRQVQHTNIDLLRSAFIDLIDSTKSELIFVPYYIGAINGGGTFIEIVRMIKELSEERGREIVLVRK